MSALSGWIALHLLLAIAGTWLAIRYARARNLIDHPGERRSHVSATPRGGGIAIVVAMLVAVAALLVRMSLPLPQLVLVGAGLVAVAGIGWVDDHRPLSAWLRLAVHAVAAALLALACGVAGFGLAQACLAFALALVLVNVWNFMDGIDGLASSQAVLVAGAVAVTSQGGIAVALAWALVAACLGFLPFNLPRARIFLGDVGSGALGYLLAVILTLGFQAGPARAWILLPLAAFLVDATLTLGTRMVRGERWWSPHVQHLYQRLARRWQCHGKVSAAYAAWTMAGIAVMWWVRSQDTTTIMSVVCAWYLFGAGIWVWIVRSLDRREGVATE